ncbi:profilin-1 [Centroberyx gerrardi]|uniref:profilin-1-like n=1 Tax=Centroberyx gerrardi TaxID=166262 RepID=UPI003AAA9D76
MSWDQYIINLMAEDSEGLKHAEEAAIVGHATGAESVWASSPGLANITPAQIKALAATNRSNFGTNGVMVGPYKCTLIRDQLDNEPWTLDIKTKASEADSNAYSITVGKSLQTFVIVRGFKDTRGGPLNKKAFDMAQHLRKTSY